MILYTIYDQNLIFKNGVFNEQHADVNYSEINVGGVMVQVSHTNNNEFRVERILSTNPADFLNPRFQPGSILK